MVTLSADVTQDRADLAVGIQVGCVLPHSGNLRCNPCRKSVIICSIWSCHQLSPFCVLIMECTISGPFKRFHCPVTRSLV
ncbi:uncharacterized protein [Haliotis cracherodii]|uniref:uncharacterized protein n=1 Tax=Haliotis cracherodii TaxID=6455 RepID=UPI0039ECD959